MNELRLVIEQLQEEIVHEKNSKKTQNHAQENEKEFRHYEESLRDLRDRLLGKDEEVFYKRYWAVNI